MSVAKAIDKDFFKKPNLLNSYWAGFIAADGNIRKDPYSRSVKLTIGLSQKDLEHLKQFKKDLKSDHKICLYSAMKKLQNQKEFKMYHTCFIYISTPSIIKDLQNNFDIDYLKSNRETFPKLSKANLKAFLTGYIDGDGCIMIPKKYPNQLSIKILGSTKILKSIKEFIEKNYKIEIGANIRIESKGIKALTVTGTYIKPFLRDLEKLDVPKLRRKWDKVADKIE